MRKTAQIMGTAMTIDVPKLKNVSVIDAAFERFREIDKKFSPYKKDSELSRYNRGELNEQALSSELKFVLHACRRWEEKTEGYFSCFYDARSPHFDAVQGSSEERAKRTSGTVNERQSVTDNAIRQEPAGTAGSAGRQGQAMRRAGDCDPSGYVKGWAIAETGKMIEEKGYKTYCIYAGGDILARSDGIKTWNIAIQHPKDKHKILNKLSISNGAVATSGNYERGKHIINPLTKRPADELLSITVIGPDIVTADVLATAAFAMGKKAAGFIKKQKGYKAIAISHNQGSNR